MLPAFDRMGAMIRHFKKVRKRLSVKYPGFFTHGVIAPLLLSFMTFLRTDVSTTLIVFT